MVDKRHTTFGELRKYETFVLPGKNLIWHKTGEFTAKRLGLCDSKFSLTAAVERVGNTLITP